MNPETKKTNLLNPETEKINLPLFLEGFRENDLTLKLALKSIYGEWSAWATAGFIPKDYSRYSPEARKEVVGAAYNLYKALSPEGRKKMDSNDWELRYACTGLLSVTLVSPMPKDRKLNVLKELDLWKEWGVSKELIEKWVASTVESKVYLKGITKIYPQVLEAIIKYADVHISREIFNNLSEKVGETELDVRSQAVFDLLKKRVR